MLLVLLKVKLYQTKNYLKNYKNQRLESLKKIHSSFKDNIWGANLCDMPPVSKFNKGFLFLLWAVHIYSKYAWVLLSKNKKGITIINAFQKF